MKKNTVIILVLLIITLVLSNCKRSETAEPPKDGLCYFTVNGVNCRIVGSEIYGIIPNTGRKVIINYKSYDSLVISGGSLEKLKSKIMNYNGIISENIVFLTKHGKKRVFKVHLNILPFVNSWFSSVIKEDTLPEIAKQGYNVVFVYVGNNVSLKKLETFLDRARSLKLMVIPQIKRKHINEERYNKIREYVKDIGNHPAVLGWYIYDEPQSTRMRKDKRLLLKLNNAARVIRKETPLKPIFICFGIYQKREEYTKDFLDTYDIYMFDRYPCFEGENEFNKHRFLFFAELLNFAREFNIEHKKTGFVFVNQGYGYDESGKPQFKRRDPTFGEYRYMIYSNLIRKPVGISNWAFYRARRKLRDEVIYPVNREYRRVINYVSNGEYMSGYAKVDEKSIRYLAGKTEKGYCIIAVNESKNEVRATFEGIVFKRIDKADVESENRQLKIRNGGFSDRFKPYQVHIYMLTSKWNNPFFK